jgi:nucleoside-diphosphate-sugar epimerase
LKILITGADGFIGRALVARLASNTSLPALGNAERHLILLDRHFAAEGGVFDGAARIEQITGNLTDADAVAAAIGDEVDVVFHLASIPGGLAEADFAAGLKVNLDGTLGLLELLRQRKNVARFVFASTIGVYGTPLPRAIDEQTMTAPTMSYGAHKLIGEILVSDYSRRRFVEGRVLRLPGIVARPPQASGLLSAFMSNLIRELSVGRNFICPVAADGMAWWMSRTRVVDNILHAAAFDASRHDSQRVWLLPVLHASIGDVVQAIGRVYGVDVRNKITYQPDAGLQAQFANLPPLSCPKSEAAGFRHDGSLDELVKRALDVA